MVSLLSYIYDDLIEKVHHNEKFTFLAYKTRFSSHKAILQDSWLLQKSAYYFRALV